MQKYTKIYMKYFGYQIAEDVNCEICWFAYPDDFRFVVDVHHIHGRGKDKDVISNLIGLCRIHHLQCHNEDINKETVQMIHDKFMKK